MMSKYERYASEALMAFTVGVALLLVGGYAFGFTQFLLALAIWLSGFFVGGKGVYAYVADQEEQVNDE